LSSADFCAAGSGLSPIRHSTFPRWSLQAGFERAQLFGQAELQIEIAMVDRPQFDVDRGGRKFARRAGKTRHAVDHFVRRGKKVRGEG
jgi:hypothetical protein